MISICESTSALQGSRDNMSIVIIALSAAPKVSEEAIWREEELDEQLEEKIAGVLDRRFTNQ